MLKDYFDPTISLEGQKRINDFLDEIPRWCVFSSYGQARSYRSVHCSKDENDRYDFRIFLYDGFYYVAHYVTFGALKHLIARIRWNEDFDLHNAAFDDYARESLARDGVKPNK